MSGTPYNLAGHLHTGMETISGNSDSKNSEPRVWIPAWGSGRTGGGGE